MTAHSVRSILAPASTSGSVSAWLAAACSTLRVQAACSASTLNSGMSGAMARSPLSAVLATYRCGLALTHAMSTRSASSPTITCVSPSAAPAQCLSSRPRILTSPSPCTVASDSSILRCPYLRDASLVCDHAASDRVRSAMKRVPGVMASPLSAAALSPAAPACSASRSTLPLDFLRRSLCVSSLARGAGPSTASMTDARGLVASSTAFSRECSLLWNLSHDLLLRMALCSRELRSTYTWSTCMLFRGT
mmetsp:Transcript_30607/g.78119  ORF Transcript_30607/g.78119 Transcript_30607/m.78119 type:complete len:249 (-) Transcript_30607:143-889(-)